MGWPSVVTASAVGVVLSPFLAPAVLGIIGFGVAGPIAGSIAAGLQASIGNVAAGSLFAGAQSVAMGGAIPAIGPIIGGAVTGGVAALANASRLYTVRLGPFAQSDKQENITVDRVTVIIDTHRQSKSCDCPVQRNIRKDPDDPQSLLVDFGSRDEALGFISSWTRHRDLASYGQVRAVAVNWKWGVFHRAYRTS